MEQLNVTQAIEKFMHPVVYTGVKPIFLVAEELVTEISVGHISEAVWIGINSKKEFSYISKFAVLGKIVFGKYYQKEEIEPFKGRLALVNQKNLKNVVLHRDIVAQIKELEIKRYKLLGEISRDFDNLENLYLEKKELYLFEKKNGEWDEELFSDFNINIPYKLISVQKREKNLHLYLQKVKKAKTKQYLNRDKFYGYFVGSSADIAGLKLKDESYLAGITSLQNEAKMIIKKIEWLSLDDIKVKEVCQELPKHPFEEYFPYVKKENVRDIEVSDKLLTTLKAIILKHMPENDNPLGMKYIPIDKLLYLFHMIISREEALSALEECDIVYEAPGIVLGHSGEHKLPPKYLVPISHVASAYSKLPSFVSLCQNFKDS
ncbi:MAG: hypothetical protein Q9M40_13360 [Sulfurimonas sp.]|nr:hypothetical protein [Sulfurimonas sp.]